MFGGMPIWRHACRHVAYMPPGWAAAEPGVDAPGLSGHHIPGLKTEPDGSPSPLQPAPAITMIRPYR